MARWSTRAVPNCSATASSVFLGKMQDGIGQLRIPHLIGGPGRETITFVFPFRVPIKACIMMLNFVREVDDIEIEVYEKPGAHLTGFNCHEWGRAYGQTRGIPSNVLHRIQRQLWTI